MSLCCIGGVCIPWSAILPLLLIVLQYIARPLHNAGLLPDIIAVRLGLTISKQATKADNENTCKKSSCCGGTENVDSNCGDEDDGGKVINIESMEEYEKVISRYNTVIIKMTAEWCKPCKIIHPFYETQLATRYETDSEGKRIKFLIVDVDEMDEIASEHKVSILPCFIALKNGKTCGKYTGSNEEKLEAFVKDSSAA